MVETVHQFFGWVVFSDDLRQRKNITMIKLNFFLSFSFSKFYYLVQYIIFLWNFINKPTEKASQSRFFYQKNVWKSLTFELFIYFIIVLYILSQLDKKLLKINKDFLQNIFFLNYFLGVQDLLNKLVFFKI